MDKSISLKRKDNSFPGPLSPSATSTTLLFANTQIWLRNIDLIPFRHGRVVQVLLSNRVTA